ncbi:TonB-dependent receptor [Helicobacter saguini]|uniref:TonB-dependent receptor n=2 Tax=Helicobacter saguini TaxID=1548018 RepID=A0A4U8T4K7_9HELI|nr:TonB-dependent receptor [Helicobacter saguini]
MISPPPPLSIDSKNVESKREDSKNIESINFAYDKNIESSILTLADADSNTTATTATTATNNSEDDEVEFDTIEISGQKIKEADKAFVTPGATSSRGKEIGETTQSIDSVIRSMPGTYTNTDQSQGSVQVNIRGMTGLGRVNTMVDGVSQTFFGTSADQGGYHAGGGTSAFGATIDQNFLAGFDVSRGSFSGGAGGNALMGSANLRTINVDDIATNTFGNFSVGALGRVAYGTNGIGPSGMVSSAFKFKPHGDSSSLGFLIAYSGRYITQNYRVGGGGSINQGSDLDGDGVIDPDVGESGAFNPSTLSQNPQSVLFKTEYKPTQDSNITFQYRTYINTLAGRRMFNSNYQLNAGYNPHDSKLVNLNFLVAFNDSRQKYSENNTIFGRTESNLSALNQATTIDLNNVFIFNFFNINYTFTPGVNVLLNDYTNTMTSAGADSTPFQPKGTQNLITTYLDNTLEYDIYRLDSNLNVVWYQLKGFKPVCESYVTSCFPKEATNINNKSVYFNASIMFSAKVHDYFMPFISYARTNRAPNVQEMFFTNNQGNSINPYLKPETADTFQVGFNGYKHGVFTSKDTLGYKAAYYYTNVKNYIYNKGFFVEDATTGEAQSFIMHLNWENLARFQGIELEFNYDIGYFYSRLAYSWQEFNQPFSETYAGDSIGFGYSRPSALPQDYGTFDIGARFFNESIIIGSIIKYTGKAKRISPISDDRNNNPANPDDMFPEIPSQDLPKIPTIWDLYIAWNPSNFKWGKYFNVRFEIQNLLDSNYMDALNAFNSSPSQGGYDANGNNIYLFNNAARGRTYIITAQLRF